LISWGPLGVFFVAIIDSAGIPMIAGVDALVVVIASLHPAQGYIAAATATAGSMLGNLLLFFIGRKGGEVYLARHTRTRRGERLHAWFIEYGLLTIFVPAAVVVPLPLKVFVLCAGALGVGPRRFATVLLAARLPRYFFLAWLGTRLGKNTIPYLRHHAWELGLFAVLLFAALYIAIRLLHRHKRHLFTDLA
jgi:membrane protein YqaA with SNARE-associated domain